MTLNWFPGHMNKARRELLERAKKSDIVFELLDARAPRASMNPMLDRVCGALPRLRLLTKADLADPAVTARWRAELGGKAALVEDVMSRDPKLTARLSKAATRLVPARGKPGFPVRAMIVGIPNVGKSTLFNTLLGEAKADVQDRPAVTRREQRGEVSNELFIIDTPGVLWPRIDSVRAGSCLCALGSVTERAFDPATIARFVLAFLAERYPSALAHRYAIDAAEGEAMLQAVGRKRGCLVKGGGVDLEKAAGIVLADLRAGRLGRVSLETPEDPPEPPASQGAPAPLASDAGDSTEG